MGGRGEMLPTLFILLINLRALGSTYFLLEQASEALWHQKFAYVGSIKLNRVR